jgi:predicted ATPase
MTVMTPIILARSFHAVLRCARFRGMSFEQYLKILAHPVFTGLNFHMPMVVDLSHPLIMLKGENGSGKSTLLHSLHYALRGELIEGFVYRTEVQGIDPKKVLLFDAEQHNPRHQLHLFEGNPEMREFLSTASHGQVMLSLFRESFPKLPDGTVLLLDEPEMALSQSNQRRILKMLKELVDQKKFRIVTATHSAALLDDAETYVIDLDRHVNRNVVPEDMGVEGQSTLH